MNKRNFPALEQFLGAYFHDDWDLEATTWEGMVDRFTAAAPSELIADVAAEISEAIRSLQTEAELQQFLYIRAGCAYDPRPNGYKMKDWLSAVRQHLERRL